MKSNCVECGLEYSHKYINRHLVEKHGYRYYDGMTATKFEPTSEVSEPSYRLDGILKDFGWVMQRTSPEIANKVRTEFRVAKQAIAHQMRLAEVRARIEESADNIYASTQADFSKWQIARQRELQAQLDELE